MSEPYKPIMTMKEITEAEEPGGESLTLRDRFAMAALPALVTSALEEDHKSWDATAAHAYLIAAAMLAQRKTP